MKQPKKMLVLTLILLLLFSLSAPLSLAAETPDISSFAEKNSFPDMRAEGHWAYDALTRAVDDGLMVGYGDGTLRPGANITRAEAATIVNNALGAEKTTSISFSDVSTGDWFYNHVAKAVAAKIFAGTSETTFSPNDNTTREQAFVILAHVLCLEDGTAADLAAFSDASDVSSWALGPAAALVRAGYIVGSDGHLYPKSDITREEFAQAMANAVSQYIISAGSHDSVHNGNVLIRNGNTTLRNVTIEGDLIIGDGVDSDSVILQDVTVAGRLLARGGSSVTLTGKNMVDKDIIVSDNSTLTLKDSSSITMVDIFGVNVKVVAESGSNITTVSTAAAGTSVSGAGQVQNVVAQSGASDTRVSTANTRIKNTGSGVVTVGNDTVAAGGTGTTNSSGTGLVKDAIGTISADDAIVGVSTMGYVDVDGTKLSAIFVEYNVDLSGAEVDIDHYRIKNYVLGRGTAACEIGENPGVVTNAYVNDKPKISENGGTGTGKYVVIEINTVYQLASGSIQHTVGLAASVIQIDAVKANAVTVTATETEFKNYTSTEVSIPGRGLVTFDMANEGTYTLIGVEGYDLYTLENGKAFQATNCFDEANGEYWDFGLPYALYVPEDYDSSKQYALVLHIADAGALGTDPMISLTKAQGPANFASEEVQQIVKDQGLGGAIVLVPQISDNFYMDEDNPNYSLRTARDNYSSSAAVPATWQLLDYIVSEYNIDTNRIYGEGQSMGGMQIAAMAAQRDNYFAALWLNGCQWGSNFNLEGTSYNGAAYYEAPVDGEIIWAVDADENAANYRNWYHMISDDNILITNCVGDPFSTGVWTELKYLYLDLTGAEIPYTVWNPLTASKEDQNAALRALVSQENELGIYWGALEGGSHAGTWIYSHGVFAHYEWLLTQTRETEMSRDKLGLDKPFEEADVAGTEADRFGATENPLLTGKFGAGTDGYNSALYGQSGKPLIKEPGWKPSADDASFSHSLQPEQADNPGFFRSALMR